MNKTYIGYARVSTVEQNEARQLVAFEGYSEKITKTFIDKMSGKNTDRPQLQAMLEYVREGDMVVVSDFSRLARSTRDMLQIVQELTDKGVGLIRTALGVSSNIVKCCISRKIGEFQLQSFMLRQVKFIRVAVW